MTSKKNTELTAGANSAQGFHDFFCMILFMWILMLKDRMSPFVIKLFSKVKGRHLKHS